jgi:hypothetical protein
MGSFVKIILITCLFFIGTLVLAAPSHIDNVKGYTLNKDGGAYSFFKHGV